MDNKEKTCCLFGHREVMHNIRPRLTAIIKETLNKSMYS